jgi:hypothetical protein
MDLDMNVDMGMDMGMDTDMDRGVDFVKGLITSGATVLLVTVLFDEEVMASLLFRSHCSITKAHLGFPE